jgi:hypothetical protein
VGAEPGQGRITGLDLPPGDALIGHGPHRRPFHVVARPPS